jgi:trehalose/maltose hydrolase-like predicted phosphorylase
MHPDDAPQGASTVRPVTTSAHWQRVYATHSSTEVSWYEAEPVTSLRFVEAAARSRSDAIIDVGAGASRLVDRLLDDGYGDVTLLDASSAALDETRARLGPRASSVTFVVADVLAFAPDRRYDVWHDRAVFHFLTSSADRARYVELASRAVQAGGTLVIGTFAEDGPTQCSGLPVCRYAPHDLATAFAPAFRLLGHEREEHHTPSGATQPFTWARFERHGKMPPADGDAAWHLRIDGDDDKRARVDSALLALSGGGIGTSGAPLLARSSAAPWLFVDGVYDGTGPATQLLAGPVLSGVEIDVAHTRYRRVLDLRDGLLYESISDGTNETVLARFAALARKGVIATRTSLSGSASRGPAHLRADADQVVDEGSTADATWVRVTGKPGGIVAALAETSSAHDIDDLVAVEGDRDGLPDPQRALDRLGNAVRDGFDTLLEEQRRAWAERWEDADIRITGDDDLQHATRFALFHLIGSAHDTDEAALGARGLTGSGYRGHVFWDADVFVLPFFAATQPAFARAMLEYRIRRLPVAQEIAREHRQKGARYAWESARTGRDVTPSSARDRAGNLVPIRTGQLEEHIVADVAWATSHYIDWTGDQAFARGAGLTMLIETARYWASRVRLDAGGSAHILGVIGPDEYHDPVDDNAFTNVMARWNLRRAADAVEEAPGSDHRVAPEETAAWRDVADALVDGYDEATGVYEQFAGFRGLEPLLIESVAPRRPIAADILLGRQRVTNSQVIKQADVLMLHHLVPDEVGIGSLAPNLRYYEPRTAHGSSLSPGVHASLFARAHDSSRALSNLEIASRIDLDDLTGSTAGGLHIATMGALWQAFVFGFAGVRPRANRLTVDPWLPESWSALDVGVRFHGARVRVRATADELEVVSDRPTEIEVEGEVFLGTPDGVRFRAGKSGWEDAS